VNRADRPGARTYLRLLGIFYRNSLAEELEYRVNFWANVTLSLFWLVWAAAGARVFFSFTGSVAGWTYHQLLVVMGLFFAMNGLRQAIVAPNLGKMSDYIRLGTLDYLLTKPVDSQFLVSLRHLGIYNWADLLLGFGLAGYGLVRSGSAPGPGELALFAVLIAAAVLLLYSLGFVLQTLTIFAVASEGADDLLRGVLEAGRFPVSFYGGFVRGALTVVVPVAFLTTYPAEALLGRARWTTAALAAAVAAAAFFASAAFWRFSLRYYVGASS